MIYLGETFDLEPASPETLDNFVTLGEERLSPLCRQLGLRLVAAWYSDVSAFCRVTHVLEFDDLAALDSLEKAGQDEGWRECSARIDEMVSARRTRLLEPFALPPETLHESSAQSRDNPLNVYSIATLEVLPGKMAQFKAMMEGAAKNLPLVANWRTVIGNPNEVTDVWKGAVRQSGYERSNDFMNGFFRALRQVAPRETLLPVFTLPYSPLR